MRLPSKQRITGGIRLEGIGAIGDALIDDIALARAVKPGGPIRLCLTGGSRSIRRYGSLGEIWAMVARSAFDQLNYSGLALVGTILAMTILYLVPPVLVLSSPLHGDLAGTVIGASALDRDGACGLSDRSIVRVVSMGRARVAGRGRPCLSR